MQWEQRTGQYQNGHNLRKGKWVVGYTEWGGSSRNDPDPKNWVAYCNLPGLKNFLGKFKTEAEAQERIERAVDYWFDGIAQQTSIVEGKEK